MCCKRTVAKREKCTKHKKSQIISEKNSFVDVFANFVKDRREMVRSKRAARMPASGTPASKKRRLSTYNAPKKSAYKMNIGKQIYFMDRMCEKLVLTGNDTTYFGGQLVTFKMSDVPNPADYQNIFDLYRLAKVEYRFLLKRNEEDATTAANQGYFPTVVWVHDWDGGQAPTGVNELYQYGSKCKELQFSANNHTSKWYTIKPARQSVVNTTGATNTIQPQWGGFLNTDDSGVLHYSLKMWYRDLYAGMSMVLQCRYYFVFKGQI